MFLPKELRLFRDSFWFQKHQLLPVQPDNLQKNCKLIMRKGNSVDVLTKISSRNYFRFGIVFGFKSTNYCLSNRINKQKRQQLSSFLSSITSLLVCLIHQLKLLINLLGARFLLGLSMGQAFSCFRTKGQLVL